ncbi:uncharacterized protein PRCAT00002773001 [Priceomyces carsonii]|uniref:uncharacterized protein n=1 Tax=Priceomyces carsonii TaxID=28549 RepID=UPI002ED92A93|nr:unnamed protein product [Priceomyces carsonii]
MSITPSRLDVQDSYYSKDEIDDYRSKLNILHQQLETYWKFEVVDELFKQSSPDTDDTTFDYMKENFGRMHSWDTIYQRIEELNKKGGPNESYKLLFLARHGQGYHNLAHAKYGNELWDDYWSKLNGDGSLTWGPDPLLTDLGVQQAKENHQQWKIEIKEHGARAPTRWFVSPLSRSIDTLIYTWDGIVDVKKVEPYIMEKLRETVGIHTCDKRSTRSIILNKYEDQGLTIEPGFAEEDIYFKTDYRETFAEHGIRMNKALQEIFDATQDDSILSLTTHSGSIRTQLLVLGHRPFAMGTGAMIPLVVKGTKVNKTSSL